MTTNPTSLNVIAVKNFKVWPKIIYNCWSTSQLNSSPGFRIENWNLWQPLWPWQIEHYQVTDIQKKSGMTIRTYIGHIINFRNLPKFSNIPATNGGAKKTYKQTVVKWHMFPTIGHHSIAPHRQSWCPTNKRNLNFSVAISETVPPFQKKIPIRNCSV